MVYGLVFRFGAYQVTRDSDHIAHLDFQDIFRVFMALIFGAFAVGQAGAFAPNYTKARLSANRIFFLLDRKPLIDGYSEEGSKPVSSLVLRPKTAQTLFCVFHGEGWVEVVYNTIEVQEWT